MCTLYFQCDSLPPSLPPSLSPTQVDEDMEGERNRRIAESKDEHSADNVERRKTYDRLVVVQEDLLKTIQGMKVGSGL